MNDRRQYTRCSPDRRHVRAGPLPLRLPVLVGILAALVMFVQDVKAETVKGLTRDGRAYVCERFERGQLLEFCVYFTRERR